MRHWLPGQRLKIFLCSCAKDVWTICIGTQGTDVSEIYWLSAQVLEILLYAYRAKLSPQATLLSICAPLRYSLPYIFSAVVKIFNIPTFNWKPPQLLHQIILRPTFTQGPKRGLNLILNLQHIIIFFALC